MAKGSQPVLVGAGQVVDHWNGKAGMDGAPSPLSLLVKAAERALADTGAKGVTPAIDTVAIVRIFEDSIPNYPHPFGQNKNLPGTFVRELGVTPKRAIYSGSGGQTPQALLLEMSNRILDGEIDVALVAGSEANLASKQAMRNGLKLDWADDSDFPTEDRTLGPRMLTRTEIKHSIIAPPRFYALMETAIAHEMGHTLEQHVDYMSKLFKPFSDVAANNPLAQYGGDRSLDYLRTSSPENYPIASPFLKWHIAQDAVNLGAAVLIMAEDKADALGIPQSKRVYLHGGAGAEDTMLSERATLTEAKAMDIAINGALDQAGITQDQISIFDLYSCFPCAVHCASKVLGIDPLTDPRPLTVTGGLPYFGGPGNNYSLHGIASMIDRLRETPDTFGLVLANGGWMTKEAAGVYSTRRPNSPPVFPPKVTIVESVEIDTSPSTGTLEAYTILYGKRGSRLDGAIAFCRTDEGRRFVAKPSDDAFAILKDAQSLPIGRRVSSTQDNEVNTFEFI